MVANNDKVIAGRVTRLFLLPACTLALLGACSEKPRLTMAEKTRFAMELIDGRAECGGHRQQLALPAKDDQALGALYESAKQAHCLKPDV